MQLPEDPRGRELVLMVERAKYERWLSNEVSGLVEYEFNNVVDLITSRKFRDLTQFQRQRALQLFRELDRQLRSGYIRISDFQIRDLRGYASLESEIARAQVASMLPGSSGPAILGAFLPRHTIESIAALPIQGLKINDWFEGQANTMSLQVRRIIQQGLVEGKGPLDIARKIVASNSTAGPVLVRRARSEARAITRTAVTAVQNDAARRSYEAMPKEVTESYRYTAIRDTRTSAICRALDGRVFKYDDPKKKIPPQHINCRSSVIPVILDENGKEIELSQAPHSFKSYDAWLRAQNATTQNEILGRERAALWREGKMTLADAVDADNRVLPVPELRAKLKVAAPNSGGGPRKPQRAKTPPPAGRSLGQIVRAKEASIRTNATESAHAWD